MTTAYFTDRDHPPSLEEIRVASGPTYPFWERLVRFIETNYQASGKWSRWGGKKKGWNIRYRTGGNALAALHPLKNGFAAQVVLGKAQVDQALALDLGDELGKMLRENPQLHDGKWLFVRILTAADVQDVEQLLRLKRRPLKRECS